MLPLIAYAIGDFAILTMTMKNSLMENLSADYVRTAVAKGLPFRKAVTDHAMRNSLIPIASHLGSVLTVFFGGSFLIETIFNIDGIGLLGYEAIVERDYPTVMGILAITSMLMLVGNIVSDICVATGRSPRAVWRVSMSHLSLVTASLMRRPIVTDICVAILSVDPRVRFGE